MSGNMREQIVDVFNRVRNRYLVMSFVSFVVFTAKYSIIWVYTNFFLRLFFSIPFCLLIRVLKPIIFIRIGDLHASKIGPLSARPELYLCEKENGLQPKNSYDLFISTDKNFVCNKQLLKMWKRKVRVWKHSIYFYVVMKKIPFGKNHIINPSTDYLFLLDNH